MGMTAFASGVLPALGAERPTTSETNGPPAEDAAPPEVGRPVRIVSIGFRGRACLWSNS